MSGKAAFESVGIGWHVGVPSGWGTYGVNLAVELARRGLSPEVFFLDRDLSLTAAQRELLSSALQKQPAWRAAHKAGPVNLDFPMLHALGNGLDFPEMVRSVTGRPNVGVVFFETAGVPKANLEQARDFAAIITGSSWNTRVLEDLGLANVRTCLQGIDPAVFSPGPKTDRFAGRFAVFSGGKLEYRKGQDLVVAAFKLFHERHPDSVLVTAWQSPWPALAQNIAASAHIEAIPETGADGRLNVTGWLRACGLTEDSFIDAGPLANTETVELLRDVDLAVFPNRSEGGTNLVAMECMACGVPVVLSRNTGHIDLIAPDNCFTLDLQIPMAEVMNRPDLAGWGESSIDELATKMEEAYLNREDAARRGAAAAAFMRDWSWEKQVGRLVKILEDLA
ncbi:MAG: glycosyltransferase family 4 protein [Rhodospirillaceae bacterium]